MNLSVKRKSSITNRKRVWAIIGAVIVFALGANHVSVSIDRSQLERNNVQISIFDIDDEITVDYPTTSRNISAKVSGISSSAEVKIADTPVSMREYGNHTGRIDYEIRNIAEGESTIVIVVQDGKRRASKTIVIKRQTKADYDNQRAESDRKRAEERAKKAEEQKRQEIEEQNRATEESQRPLPAAQPPQQHTQAQQSVPRPPQSSAPQPSQDQNLPLKAICKDGTVQYQDSPSLPNYRGMCSDHGGIKTKLGRVP